MSINEGKDLSPEETVDKIRGILESYAFHSDYIISEPRWGNYYWSRVTVDGFGSNGKGVSKAFCKASGYAELMERMQNRSLNTPSRNISSYTKKIIETFPTINLEKDVLPDCVQNLKDQLLKSSDASIVDEILDKLSYFGKYELSPFYSLKEEKEILLPKRFLCFFTGTNGMAAGNTLEEALVQAICEIFERYATLKIIFDELTPPEIPREYIERNYPDIARVICEIEADEKYTVSIFDASLGKQIPCVGCIIKNTETLSFGLKFGAAASFEIALERCFSEAVQGWSLKGFSETGKVSYAKVDRSSWLNIINILKISRGNYPVTIFGEKASWEFRPWGEIEEDNKSCLRKLIKTLTEYSDDVYIQDVSFMGFPTVYVYAPGVSEISPVDVLWLQEYEYKLELQKVFGGQLNPDRQVLEHILNLAKIKRYSYLDKNVNSLAGRMQSDELPGNPDEISFFAGAVAYALGRDDEARSFIASAGQSAYVRTVQHYLIAKQKGLSTEYIRKLLCSLTKTEIAEKVLYDFEDRSQVLNRIYDFCDGNCDCCTRKCEQKQIQESYLKLLKIEVNQKVRTEKIRKLFKDIQNR